MLASLQFKRLFIFFCISSLITGSTLIATPINSINNVSYGFEINSKQAILIDPITNTVLYEKEADISVAPSSMSKMMTIYVVFDMLKKGTIKLTDQINVSHKAWKTEGSRTFLNLNTLVSVEDLIRGVVVQSGNDAAVALAEACGGTEAGFVEKMNQKGKEIGLTNSLFMNATGLPDESHVMTMRDLATLSSRTIQDFPQYYSYYGEHEFTYNNIKQPNRNPLLWNFKGTDGLKTGHTDKAGFGVAASAVQGDRRLILVINGNKSMAERAKDAETLMSWGFRYYTNVIIASKSNLIRKINVWQGQVSQTDLTIDKDIIITIPRIHQDKFKVEYNIPSFIEAPLKKGQVVGKIIVTLPEGSKKTYLLKTRYAVEQANIMMRLKNHFYRLIWGYPKQP